MNFPRVSVIMSVFNGEAYLRHAIDSVLEQTFEDFELIVIDNASVDGTAAILDTIADPRLVRLRNDSTLTITASLKRGVVAARGEFLARLDADDLCLPERLARQVAYLDIHRDVTLLASGWIDLIPDGSLQTRDLSPPSEIDDVLQAFACGNPFVHSTIMMRRQPVVVLGDYSEDFSFAQDYELYLRLLANGYCLAALPEPLLQLRHHQQQFSMRPETALVRTEEEERLLTVARALPGLSQDSILRNSRALASIRVRKGKALWQAGRRGDALVAWTAALGTDPKSCLTVAVGRLLTQRTNCSPRG